MGSAGGRAPDCRCFQRRQRSVLVSGIHVHRGGPAEHGGIVGSLKGLAQFTGGHGDLAAISIPGQQGLIVLPAADFAAGKDLVNGRRELHFNNAKACPRAIKNTGQLITSGKCLGFCAPLILVLSDAVTQERRIVAPAVKSQGLNFEHDERVSLVWLPGMPTIWQAPGGPGVVPREQLGCRPMPIR